VWIQLQIRVAPLHDGDGAALTAGDTLGAHTPPAQELRIEFGPS